MPSFFYPLLNLLLLCLSLMQLVLALLQLLLLLWSLLRGLTSSRYSRLLLEPVHQALMQLLSLGYLLQKFFVKLP